MTESATFVPACAHAKIREMYVCRACSVRRRLHRCDSGARPRRPSQPAPRAFAALAALLALGCGGSETDNELEVSASDDGVEYRAEWSYESFEVDVELTLVTLEGASSCSSHGSLVINDVVSAAADYRLAPTDCTLLRLTGGGDIVLGEQATDHDWTGEALRVDTDRELVQLGPVTLADPQTGEARALRFTIAAPPCPDDHACDCGALKRLGGTEEPLLDLGRRCD
jgi:hypothetical protein